jgi:hypothetical protein
MISGHVHLQVRAHERDVNGAYTSREVSMTLQPGCPKPRSTVQITCESYSTWFEVDAEDLERAVRAARICAETD